LNTATVEIDQSLSSKDLIELIEDLGFEASLLEIEVEPDIDTATVNPLPLLDGSKGIELSSEVNLHNKKGLGRKQGKDVGSINKINRRKLMIQIEEADYHILVSIGDSVVLEKLRNQPGVLEASYSNSNGVKDADTPHFKVIYFRVRGRSRGRVRDTIILLLITNYY
jgi:hypothetical protein